MHELLRYLWLAGAWLREPVVLLLWAVVPAIVLGVGRGLGLPVLFWHERRAEALLAGLASTLLAAVVFFVLFLIHAEDPRADQLGLGPHLFVGGVVWGAVVLAGVIKLQRAARGDSPRGVAPRMAYAGGDSGPARRPPPVSPWPFVAGAAVAIAIVVAWWAVDAAVAAAFDRLATGALPWMGGSRQVHLHVTAAVLMVALGVSFWVVRRVATPAIGLCLLLGISVLGCGAVTFWTQSRGLPPVAAFLLLYSGGRGVFRLRLGPLGDFYPSVAPAKTIYPPAQDATGFDGDAPLLLDRLVGAGEGAAVARGPAWPDLMLKAVPAAKRPLVFVCCSGGGIRAAVWTAGLLGRLDSLAGFRLSTRMVTGASGGMVGAAKWMAWRYAQAAAAGAEPAKAGDWQRLLRCTARESLTAVARQLFFNDIPRAFSRGVNPHDRGQALEGAWIAAVSDCLGARLDLPIRDLRDGEARGLWPSLVFSPMLVEDGRRVVASNLDLASVRLNQARWLTAGVGAPGVEGDASYSAYHMAELFPDAWPRFPLSTAARLSASFPYVSPAAALPLHPRRRIVDAGYYDNYGMDLTCGWLREALEHSRDWIAANVSGVLVIQIRDNVYGLSHSPDAPPAPQAVPPSDGAALGRGLEGLTSPPEGLLAAMDAVALFRNDAQLETVTHLYGTAFGRGDFVTTVSFELDADVSTSWYLTRNEIDAVEQQVNLAAERVDRVGQWLAARGVALAAAS
jgi:hypothetical protein